MLTVFSFYVPTLNLDLNYLEQALGYKIISFFFFKHIANVDAYTHLPLWIYYRIE